MKTSLFLATSVLAKGNQERRGGGKRVLDSEARCYLRPEDGMDQCCANGDYGIDGCQNFRGCVPALLAQGIPCNNHPNGCMCDDACVHFNDCCPDHIDTCPQHYDNPWEPETTTFYSTTTDEPTTTDYTTTEQTTTTEPLPCVGFVQMPTHSKMTWKHAKKTCRLLGGELAFFENEAELAIFNELQITETTWLGIIQSKKGKNFIDVQFREPIKVTNWNNGEPNNSGGVERCVEAYTNGLWNDQECDDKRTVTCRFVDHIYC